MDCIVCEKPLSPAFSGRGRDNEAIPPSQGLVFTARGNYGSEVFDPMDETWLEINVCDECIVRRSKSGAVLHCAKEIPIPVPQVTATPWTPNV